MEEDEQTFLARRVAEERQKAKVTSCLVSSVHEEMVELYEEREQTAVSETEALETLLDKLT